jgi:hypothetical protein
MNEEEKFAFIEPITIDDTKFGFTDLNEPEFGVGADPALWNAATAYAAADRVTRSTTHRIYQRLIAGTTATAPESDLVNWVVVGPTNKWAMWDASNSSQTQKAENFSYHIFLGASDVADTVVFDNVDADVIRLIAFTDGFSTEVYDETIVLKTHNVDNWYDYFFSDFVYAKTAVFDGLPPLTGMIFSVTVFKSGSIAKVGTCVVGRSRRIGWTHFGASVGLVDFSVKSTDSFGNTTFVERPYSKRMNVAIEIRSDRVDEVVNALAPYRAKPVMYLGVGGRYASMVMLGKYQSFDVVIPGPVFSQCNLEIEGLT